MPQTALIGAILATGWLGGAIATHLKVGKEPVTQTVISVLLWVGLALGNRHP